MLARQALQAASAKALLCALALLGFSASASADAPRIAIIIDDLGYELRAGRRAIALPGPIACAVLPGTPRGRLLAEAAHAEGKEVLLHLPLQALVDVGHPARASDVSHVGHELNLDMSRRQFADAFAASLAAVPHASGVNNHRGSLLTRHPGHMRWLMDEISRHGDLLFIDSYTTADSVALQIARERNVPSARRDVFLDPDPSPETLAREFERLKSLARKRGAAVGIGHPYPATLSFLEAELPTLREQGFELVSLQSLLHDEAGRPAATAAE